MLVNIGDTVELRDKSGQSLGKLTVEEGRHEAWCGGTFTPAPGYARIRDLFVEWTSLVNDQSFNSLEAMDAKISTIGISAFRDTESLPIKHLQIYDEGGRISVCFKLSE